MPAADTAPVKQISPGTEVTLCAGGSFYFVPKIRSPASPSPGMI